MNDLQPEDLLAVLEKLAAEWLSRAQDAQDKARNLVNIGAARGEYYRGIADAYGEVMDEIRALLEGDAGEDGDEAEPITFAEVSEDTALTVLKLAGLSAAELHANKDHSFSVMFLPLQFRSIQEVENRLLDVADVVILDHGRLSNSNKSFVDFAFKTPPT